jgi:hypothetical protein
MRLGGIFVAVCMMLIAGSGGAIAHFAFGVALPESAALAVSLLAALALYNAIARRLHARARRREIADLADLVHQVAEIGRRLAALEVRVEVQLHRPTSPPRRPTPRHRRRLQASSSVGTLMPAACRYCLRTRPNLKSSPRRQPRLGRFHHWQVGCRGCTARSEQNPPRPRR